MLQQTQQLPGKYIYKKTTLASNLYNLEMLVVNVKFKFQSPNTSAVFSTL